MQSDRGPQGSDSNRAAHGHRQSSRRASLSIDALYTAAREEVPLDLLSDHKLSESDHFRLAVQLNLTYQQAMAGTRPLQDVIAALHLYVKTFVLQLPTSVAILVYDMLGSALCIQCNYAQGLGWLVRAKKLCDGAAKLDITFATNVEQHYGNALLNVGQVTAAVEALRRAVDLASLQGGAICVEALFNLSAAYEVTGDRDGQRNALKSASTIAQTAGLDAYYAACQSKLREIP